MRSLDELRVVDRLAATRHFGRTSAELHLTPSTVSRTISRLEAELGERLFDRDRRTVSLTPAGVRFSAFVTQVLDAWRAYSEGEAEGEVGGRLAIFCTVTASQTIVPDVLGRFRDRYPGVELVLSTGYAAEALERLEDGSADVSVAALPARVPRHVLTRTITTTSLVPVRPRGSDVVLPAVPSSAWSDVPFVLPASGLSRALVDRWFRRLRVQPSVAAEAEGHEAVLSLVALGCGIGIVPELVARQGPLAARLEVVAVDVDLPSFDIAVCTVPDRLRAGPVAAFWDSLDDLEAGGQARGLASRRATGVDRAAMASK